MGPEIYQLDHLGKPSLELSISQGCGKTHKQKDSEMPGPRK